MNPFAGARITPLAVLLLTLSLVVQSCSSSTDSSNPSTLLDASRDLWKSKKITDYRFTFNWVCFCTPTYVRPVRITVRNGEIAQIVYADDESIVDPQLWDEYRKIDQLFDVVQEAHDRPAFQVNAKYNQSYGYPEDVYVDYQEGVADEEKGFRIVSFEVLS